MKSVWMSLLLLGFPISLSYGFGNGRQLKLVNEWKTIDFNFPTQQLRQDAIQRRQFVMGMPVPLDIDVHYKGLLDFFSAKRVVLKIGYSKFPISSANLSFTICAVEFRCNLRFSRAKFFQRLRER